MKQYVALLLLLVSLLAVSGDNSNIMYFDRRQQQSGGPSSSVAPSNSVAPSSSGAAPPQSSGGPVGNNTVPTNGTQAGNNTSGLGALPTSASFGVSVQPGYATFIQPTPSKSVSPLYRIDPKENITFVWSYSNLQVRPVNLTLAAVGPQSMTYTIAGLPGDATSYVWQLGSVVPKTPLMNGYYQIQLYDQRGPTAYPSPGWLMPNSRLSIAFYSPESYQAQTNSNYCPTCFYSAAWKQTFGPIGIAFAVACITSVLLIVGMLN
ncbi:hypothetical protein BC940DRAFT_312390 [Gongronella butleri]|nr:hypothetical protein BC940DRAFT_312390 [Gongronella butleri]